MYKAFLKISIRAAAVAACICLISTQAVGCTKEKEKVKKVNTTVSISDQSISLLAGYTQTLSAVVKSAAGTSSSDTGVWSSDNSAVAAVDEKGLVTAVKAGECRVTYAVGTKAKAVCNVTVTPSQNWTTVLMYHSIAVSDDKLRVPPGNFGQEMKWLYDNNYISLSLDQLYEYIASKKPFPEKAVVITLDDGYIDNYYGVFPYLKKYHMHATIFMITSKIGTDGYLTADQLKTMSDKGNIDIEDHTVTHPFLDTLSYDEQYKELNDSKKVIEGITGKKVEYLAYPTGRYNQDTIAVAKKLGYKMCFKMEGGSATLQDSPYEFPRAFADRNLNTLIDAVNGLGY